MANETLESFTQDDVSCSIMMLQAAHLSAVLEASLFYEKVNPWFDSWTMITVEINNHMRMKKCVSNVSFLYSPTCSLFNLPSKFYSSRAPLIKSAKLGNKFRDITSVLPRKTLTSQILFNNESGSHTKTHTGLLFAFHWKKATHKTCSI